MNNKVETIRHVPYFQSLSKAALNRYQHFFIEVNFNRGAYAQIEGRPMTHLHLVTEGEFGIS